MRYQSKRDALSEIVPDVSRETFERLLALEVMVDKWNRAINLIADQQVWTRHILDSAQAWTLGGTSRSWIDLGSGSGFPGLVIATLADPTENCVRLVESNGKKASFLKNAVAQLGLPAIVQRQRVETLTPIAFATVTARAFAPLNRTFEWAYPVINGAQRALLYKGRSFEAEIAEANRDWLFDVTPHPSVLPGGGVILEITNLRRR